MKKFLHFLFSGSLLIIIYGCETQPPVSPEGVSYIAGKIYVNYSIEFDSQPQTTNKVVLLEDFANVSCVPCVQSDQIIERYAQDLYGPSKLSVVKFATNFPSPADPFYLANKPTCDTRMSLYNVLFAPTIVVDGTNRPTSTDSTAIKNSIDLRSQVSPPLFISVNHNFIDSAYTVNVDIKIFNNSGLDLNNLVIQTVIAQKEVVFSSPPGSNGETKFYYVMRTMIPSYEGIDLSTISHTGNVTMNEEGNISSNWNLSKINTVVFIQDKSTKEIYQSSSTY